MSTKKVRPARKPKVSPAFWLVWRDGRYDRVPNWRHGDEKAARAEAERLSRQFPGCRFYVLPASAYVESFVSPPEWKTATATPSGFGIDAADEDVPF